MALKQVVVTTALKVLSHNCFMVRDLINGETGQNIAHKMISKVPEATGLN